MNYNTTINITATNSSEAALKKAQKDVHDLNENVKTLKEGFKLLAESYVVEKGIEFFKSLIDLGNEMTHLSEKTGIGVQTLSNFRTIAERNGLELSQLEQEMKKFSLTTAQADAGNVKATSGFVALGISLKDANGKFKDTDTLLLEVAKRFAENEDGPKKVAAAVALMGRAGADAIPFLNKLGEDVHQTGVIMSKEFLEAAHGFEQRLIDMKVSAENFGTSILEKTLPALNSLIDKAKEFATSSAGRFAINGLKFNPATAGIGFGLDTLFGGSENSAKNGGGEVFGPPAPKRNDIKPIVDLETTKRQTEAIAKLKEQLVGAQQIYQLETQRLGLTTAEFDKQKIAIEEMTKAKKEDATFTAAGKKTYEDLTRQIIAQKQALIDFQEQQKHSFGVGAQEAIKEYADSIRDVAAQTKQLFTDSFKGIEDALVTFATKGQLSFANLAAAIEADLARIAIRQAIIAPLIGLVSGFFNPAAAAGGIGASGNSSFATPKFAGGGIMTSEGPMPLRRYAGGGIASSPQLAMFGEGSMNEAYVPLPDGRSIPVSMKGGGTNVSVNVSIDSSGKDKTSGDGKQIGNLIAASVKQVILQEKRPGGLLA